MSDPGDSEGHQSSLGRAVVTCQFTRIHFPVSYSERTGTGSTLEALGCPGPDTAEELTFGFQDSQGAGEADGTGIGADLPPQPSALRVGNCEEAGRETRSPPGKVLKKNQEG